MILNYFLYSAVLQFISLYNSECSLKENSTDFTYKFIHSIKYSRESFDFMVSDTAKTNESTATNNMYYIIAGSYLIPKNAEKQVLKLKKLGFNKCYKYNFRESEYYSVVVDTFKLPSECNALIARLQINKIDYFIKNY